VSSADTSSTWDVHIGHLPPHRWDELPDTQRAREVIGGRRERPAITMEPIEWEALRITPRWLEDDSSNAVAAIQPSNVWKRGATEWERFTRGAQRRNQPVLTISEIGSLEEPDVVWPGGPTSSISLPVDAPGVAYVSGTRISLARVPPVVDGLEPADEALARLLTARDPELPWWSLELTGAERSYGPGAREWIDPQGTLSPLLISTAGETVAAVWTSADEATRHYVIPWMPAWTPALEWLGRDVIPECVLSGTVQHRPSAGEQEDTAEEGHSQRPKIARTDSPAEPTAAAVDSAAPSDPDEPVSEYSNTGGQPVTQRRNDGRGGEIGSHGHGAWTGMKKAIVALTVTVAGGVAVAVVTHVMYPDKGPQGPETPNLPVPSTSLTATSTTQSSTTEPLKPAVPPAPPGPPEEQVIHAGSSGEFFQRAVIVGVGNVFSNWSHLTITTGKLSCTTNNLDVGQAVAIAGESSGRDDYFRVTLLQSTPDVSSTVRVEELPFSDWPSDWQATASCPH
jgi:hypothetical protein